ncbi:FAD-binding domain-containing protein [Venturia nashicola]|uniref:FAD-binding domain-containing protein n=1 Tax=Venturia nashicola TaxID=86259 RepID=A0A4Z1NQI5_9PEZI|nr:FAD-binding domain-containing protein [Venturia nashicola]
MGFLDQNSFLFLAVLALLPIAPLGTASPTLSSCKAVPGNPTWPSDADWATLNKAVGGRLLKPAPPAAVCHRGWPNYSAAACSSLNEGWKNSDWHAENPTSSMWQNHNNYSCPPEPNAPCTTAGYPVYVVAAKNADDVKAAVDFARTKNIRLNIKSTGHDYLGRSTQPYSLSIWTHGLKGMRWFDASFSPSGCKISIPGPAVTVGSGSQWGEVFDAAQGRNIGLVGGNFKSVSVGGHISGGGHGLLSAKYGLAADNVLEITLVNANGEAIIANECQNSEYFWAMRGGGGSTYGVAMSYTLQGIRSGASANYRSTLNGWDQITYMHSQWPKIAAAGGSGYIKGYPGKGSSSSISVTVHLPNATSAVLHRIVDPIMSSLHRRSSDAACHTNTTVIRGDGTVLEECNKVDPGEYTDFPTFEAAQRVLMEQEVQYQPLFPSETAATFPGLGANKIVTSWLWSAADVASPRLRAALQGAFDAEAQLLTDATMGVGIQKPPFIRGGGNAVNPVFRTAIMRPASELQWEGTDPNKLAKRKADALKFGASLKSLSPSGGTYSNEADPDTPDWQHAFWGTNYEKLLAIKRKVDPTGVFYCRACVGIHGQFFTSHAA